jgi:RNA polymerase sigma-70 factor (ECF subfamily)
MVAISANRDGIVPSQPPTHLPKESSLSEIYDEHVGMVWRTLKALGVEASALDDAVQDVFVVVHRRHSDFEARSTLKTWLFGIAYRVAANCRRGAKRHNSCELPEELVCAGPNPQQELQQAEAARFVQRFLEGVDEPQRAVFTACLLEGMTVPEAAEALGVNTNTLYSRLRVVRSRFRAALTAKGSRP